MLPSAVRRQHISDSYLKAIHRRADSAALANWAKAAASARQVLCRGLCTAPPSIRLNYTGQTGMKLKNLQHPVPQDIEIAQAAEPVFIGQIAADLGINEDELNLHGKHKAKVEREPRSGCT